MLGQRGRMPRLESRSLSQPGFGHRLTQRFAKLRASNGELKEGERRESDPLVLPGKLFQLTANAYTTTEAQKTTKARVDSRRYTFAFFSSYAS